MTTRWIAALGFLFACSTAHKATHDAPVGPTDDADPTTDGNPVDPDAPTQIDARVIDAFVIDAFVPPVDASTVGQACNPLSQTTCGGGEKCTWYQDDMSNPPLGHSACAPNGNVAIGGACAYGAPGVTGYDNCVAGSVCTGGKCEAICDLQGAAPACAASTGCVAYSGLFGPVGGPQAAGVCDPSCDPLADNDYDGAGGASVRTGTACGTDVNVGCYGIPTDMGAPTHFICAAPATGTATLVHRNVIPANLQYLNACHPGYTIAFAADTTGSTNVDCYAWCKPGNSYLGAATQQPNGQPGGACAVNSGARQGAFGVAATAAVNGEHCMYSWNFELDATGVLHRSPTSDTLGICWDHTKYNFDDDGNPGTPNIVYPRCGNLPLTSTTTYTAVDFACVDSVTAGLPFGGKTIIHQNFHAPLIVPAFDPRFQMSFSPR